MNSKDYELIAKSLRQNREANLDLAQRARHAKDEEAWNERAHGVWFAIHNMAQNLERKHDNFDKKKFLKACGL